MYRMKSYIYDRYATDTWKLGTFGTANVGKIFGTILESDLCVWSIWWIFFYPDLIDDKHCLVSWEPFDLFMIFGILLKVGCNTRMSWITFEQLLNFSEYALFRTEHFVETKLWTQYLQSPLSYARDIWYADCSDAKQGRPGQFWTNSGKQLAGDKPVL